MVVFCFCFHVFWKPYTSVPSYFRYSLSQEIFFFFFLLCSWDQLLLPSDCRISVWTLLPAFTLPPPNTQYHDPYILVICLPSVPACQLLVSHLCDLLLLPVLVQLVWCSQTGSSTVSFPDRESWIFFSTLFIPGDPILAAECTAEKSCWQSDRSKWQIWTSHCLTWNLSGVLTVKIKPKFYSMANPMPFHKCMCLNLQLPLLLPSLAVGPKCTCLLQTPSSSRNSPNSCPSPRSQLNGTPSRKPSLISPRPPVCLIWT